MRVHTGSRKNKHPVEHLHNHQFNKTRLARIRNDFVATSQRTLSTSAHNACLQHLQSARNRSFEWEVTYPFSRQTFFFSFRHTVNFVDGSSLFFYLYFFFTLDWMYAKHHIQCPSNSAFVSLFRANLRRFLHTAKSFAKKN